MFLCPGNIVVSGHVPACERIAQAAVEAGAMKVIPLAVAGAFHTPLMEPAVSRLQAALATAQLHPPQIPVVSNVDARPHTDLEEIRQLLARQVVQPVLWEDSVRYLLDQGVGEFSEVGPGTVLRSAQTDQPQDPLPQPPGRLIQPPGRLIRNRAPPLPGKRCRPTKGRVG